MGHFQQAEAAAVGIETVGVFGLEPCSRPVGRTRLELPPARLAGAIPDRTVEIIGAVDRVRVRNADCAFSAVNLEPPVRDLRH